MKERRNIVLAKAGVQEDVSEKRQDKDTKKSRRLMIIVGVSVAIAIIIITIAAIVLINMRAEQERREVINEYNAKMNEVENLFSSFGVALAEITQEEGLRDYMVAMYDEDETKYDDYLTQLMAGCMNTAADIKYGLWAIEYSSPYIKDTDTIVDILEYMDKLETIDGYLRSATDKIEKCRPLIIAEKAKKDKEAEDARVKAEQEAAEKAAQEERDRKASMTYNKFANEIREGMTVKQIKEVWTGFDVACSISSQSGPYIFYSCKGYSSYWVVSLGFYNGRLTTKSQTGLH